MGGSQHEAKLGIALCHPVKTKMVSNSQFSKFEVDAISRKDYFSAENTSAV